MNEQGGGDGGGVVVTRLADWYCFLLVPRARTRTRELIGECDLAGLKMTAHVLIYSRYPCMCQCGRRKMVDDREGT